MNLYSYLMSQSNNTTRVAKEAKKAYELFRARGLMFTPQQEDVDPFVFMAIDHGYQAFTFRPDQVVKNKQGDLAIVTGWKNSGSRGWLVRIKTAKCEYDSLPGELTPAAFPEGLVEILRDRVHGKVDEAFA